MRFRKDPFSFYFFFCKVTVVTDCFLTKLSDFMCNLHNFQKVVTLKLSSKR